MIVEVIGGTEEHPEARVVDIDNLTALHLALGEVTDEEAGEVLEAAGLGRMERRRHRIPRRRGAAGHRRTAGEHTRLGDAVGRDDRARPGKGWLTEDGASIQVHVESAAGA